MCTPASEVDVTADPFVVVVVVVAAAIRPAAVAVIGRLPMGSVNYFAPFWSQLLPCTDSTTTKVVHKLLRNVPTQSGPDFLGRALNIILNRCFSKVELSTFPHRITICRTWCMIPAIDVQTTIPQLKSDDCCMWLFRPTK